MTLEMEHRPSTSPYIERVWRARSSNVTHMQAVAGPRWALAFSWQHGKASVSVVGPESRASIAPVPEDAEFFGIDFALGTGMPHLPPGRIVDEQVEIPDVTDRSFHLAGSSWHLPSYDAAETFVRRLVREGIVVRDPLVADVARGAAPDVSERTVQRHFLAATGLTRGAVRQIDRARAATVLLDAGEPTGHVVDRLGYFDHPHLHRSLRRFVGRTATCLRTGGEDLPLSLVYTT